MKYDIIGDIHGQADLLEDLLERMGYQNTYGFYQHPERKAIFVGDFINRGPKIRKCLQIVRAMVENNAADAVLGNHEIYALLYSLRDRLGKRLTNKASSYKLSLEVTLSEFADYQEEWKLNINWLRTLPLYLDYKHFRVVHAYWNKENIDQLSELYSNGNKLKRSELKEIARGKSAYSKAFWETCRGLFYTLPKDMLLYDRRGVAHQSFRMRWWNIAEKTTFKSLSFDTRFDMPEYDIPSQLLPKTESYATNEPIVFFGHYCLKTKDNIVQKNLCCLDSCVRRSSKLTAYRWDGETELLPSKIFQ